MISVICCVCSAALDIDHRHRVCFRSLHAAEFQRQSQVAAAAAAAVAGFSAFNLHSSATHLLHWSSTYSDHQPAFISWSAGRRR